MSRLAKSMVAGLIVLVILLTGLNWWTYAHHREHVHHVYRSSRAFIKTSFELQSDIDRLLAMHKGDTAQYGYAPYEIIRQDFEGHAEFRLFTLAKSVNETEANQDELNQLGEEYHIALNDVQDFLELNDSFAACRPGQIDTLLTYFGRLKEVTERFEKMEPAL